MNELRTGSQIHSFGEDVRVTLYETNVRKRSGLSEFRFGIRNTGQFRTPMLKLIISFLLSTSIYCNTLVCHICNRDYKRFHYQPITSSTNSLAVFVTLKEINQDTVVVFTSDHGDMLGDHLKLNKEKPYESSMGIPFIVKYPGHVPKGKIIETAYSSAEDFAPAILGLLGVPQLPPDMNFHGVDGSQELMSNQTLSTNCDQILFSDSWQSWAAAITSGFKFIVSSTQEAFLFDLFADPEELINFIASPEHQDVKAILQSALVEAGVHYEMVLFSSTSNPLGSLTNRYATIIEIYSD